MTSHILQVVPGPGWPPTWSWSARPDLWPPGAYRYVYQVGERIMFAWWAVFQSDATEAMERARDQGLDQPGVAEAAILAPGVGVSTWTS